MSNQPSPNQWKLNVSEVQKALESLCKAKIHPAFAGYLCLKLTSSVPDATNDLRPNFRDFFDTFLKVPGGPVKKPYVLPFVAQGTGSTNIWFNENVAGSYAPSSIRSQSPMRQVCTFSGNRNETVFQLVNGHSGEAKRTMLFGGSAPIDALCIFLYRNHALEGENPSGDALLTLFRKEFGFRDHIPQEREQFLILFESDGQLNSSYLFEPA